MTAGLAEYRHAQELALHHARNLIVLAQAETGDSVPYATRPLNANEKAAKVRFALLDAIEERAVKDAQGPIEDLFVTVSAALLGAVDGTGEDEAREALQGLLLTPPEDVLDGISSAAGDVEGALNDAYVAASAVALDEADRQGVTDLPDPLRPSAGQFAPAAAAAASRVWTRTAQVVQEDALAVGTVATPDTVSKALERAATDGAVDQARQGVHQAQGTGRIDTIEKVVESGWEAEFFASELLDGKQCDPCQGLDGKRYDSLADARLDYPEGYAARCQGGPRCRGTIVSLYRPAPRG